MALLDSSGNVSSYVDVNLPTVSPSSPGTPPTVDDVQNAITSALASANPPLQASVALNAGQLVLSATQPASGSAVGINVATLSGGLSAAAGATPIDFASYFSLPVPSSQQLLTGGTASTPITAINIAVRSDILAHPTKLSVGNGSMATMLSNALLKSQPFSSSVVGRTGFANATTALGLSGGFTIGSGSNPVTVNVGQTDSLAQIAANINAAAQTAGSSVTASVVNGSNQLQISTGNTTALTFAGSSGTALSELGIAIAPNGFMGPVTTTFAGYATAITSDIATRANTADANQTTKEATFNALQQNLSSQSGVNTDEESAKLVALQNAYAASAKVISTFQAMFSALLNAVQ